VNEALDHSFSKWVDHYVSMEKDRTIVNLELLENEPNAYKLYLVKYLIGKNISMRKHQWENLKYLINEGNTGMILVIEDQEILKDRSTIIIKEKCKKAQNTYKVQEEQLIMDKDFTFEQKYISDHLLNDRSENETIDGDSLPNDLTLRPWNKGDQFRPLGMKGMKSVSDYLTDIKMDRFTKRDQYVLADGKEVFWLCGQRISDKVKVTPETTRFLELSFRWNVG
jgi:tRNA(Ile)-lysidine synthetase-like protein